MTPEPIMVDCEESGNPILHGIYYFPGYPALHGPRTICPMCGGAVPVLGIGLPEAYVPLVIAPHERQDILAMIDRGDFG